MARTCCCTGCPELVFSSSGQTVCAPAVTHANWQPASSAPAVATTGPPGAVLKVSCIEVGIIARAAPAGRLFDPVLELAQAVDDGRDLGHRGRIGDREGAVGLAAAGAGINVEHRGHGHYPGVGRDPPGTRAAGPITSPAATPARMAHRYARRRWPGLAAARMAMSVMALRRRPRPPGSGGCRTVTR